MILTSDDFGMSLIFNKKIIELIKMGYLSSVSIMINRYTLEQTRQFDSILSYYKQNKISLGLHLEISEQNVISECQKQWNKFISIFGFKPNYIDIHKGKLIKNVHDLIANFCLSKNICFRKYLKTKVNTYSPTKSFVSTNKSLKSLINIIDNLKHENIYELIFHIGLFDPKCKSNLNKGREKDIEKLKYIFKYIMKKKIKIVNYKKLISELEAKK